jgi:hypothetical protein
MVWLLKQLAPTYLDVERIKYKILTVAEHINLPRSSGNANKMADTIAKIPMTAVPEQILDLDTKGEGDIEHVEGIQTSAVVDGAKWLSGWRLWGALVGLMMCE